MKNHINNSVGLEALTLVAMPQKIIRSISHKIPAHLQNKINNNNSSSVDKFLEI